MINPFLVIAGVLLIAYSGIIYTNLLIFGKDRSVARFLSAVFYLLPIIGSTLIYFGLT